MKKYILFPFLLFPFFVFGQIEKGNITDSIQANDQLYAFYVPSDYDSLQVYPVIVIFEPMGRAKLPIKRLLYAAEKYKYILIGSYTYQNGIPLPDIYSKTIQDAQKRLSINKKRIYLCGFSGGARFSFRTESMYPLDIKGIIACGAGLHEPLGQFPQCDIAFTIGRKDFNFLEVENLAQKCVQKKIPHHITYSDSTHQWATVDEFEECLEFFELMAIQKKWKSSEDAFVKNLFEKRKKQAQTFEETARYGVASHLYQNILQQFKGLISDSELALLEEKNQMLTISKPFQKEKKQREKEYKEEREQLLEMIKQFDFIHQNPDSVFRKSYWSKEYSRLSSCVKRQEKTKSDLCVRLIEQVRAMTYESVQFDDMSAATKQKVVEILLIFAPEEYYAHYLMAQHYAQIEEISLAIKYLKNSLKYGFKAKKYLLNDKAFDTIKEHKDFKTLVESIQ